MSDVAEHNLLPVRRLPQTDVPQTDAPHPDTPPTHTRRSVDLHPETGRTEPDRQHAAPRTPSVAHPEGLGRALLTFATHILVPLFLAAGMGLAYLGAFHAPQPKDLPVGIVGQGSASQVFAQTVTDESDGALVAHVVASSADARTSIRDRDLAAVYEPGATSATLYVSSAASDTTATVAGKVFAPIAFAQKLPLRTVDVVAAGADDSTGQGLFFLLVALSVGGYSSAIAVAAFAARLRLLWTAVVGLATAGVVAGIGIVIAGPVYGVVTHHEWQIFLFAWMYDAAIIGLGVGLHPMLGRWTTPVLTMLFVMLNFTSSGGIFQPALQPGFFAGLNTFWSGAAWLGAAQDLQYFPGASLGRSALVLSLWLAAAVLLVGIVHGLVARRTRIARERAVTPLEEEEVVAA
ncbi:hypothetical protein [Curtobacterium sp. Leaf261]|uniref:hypothetical protein n=1 Tax=Curtobacterium sp. Leaf261 TaxID=1736311 RepID=UPI0007013867|nr:hypothetical protein [Curtobacterium sp. Leaf261]KQO65105.1 hypothetical protein ASF23_02990 [Curtobacterium sp. Leaf261]